MTSRIASASSSRTSGRSATPARSAASRARSQAASRDIHASVPAAGTRTGRRRERRRLAGADAEVSAARGGRQLLPLAVVEVGATAPLHETHHRRDDRGNERQTEQPPEEPSLLLAVLPAHRISLLGRLVHARVEWARLDLNQRPHPYQNHAPRTYSGIPAGAALIRATYLDCAIPLHGRLMPCRYYARAPSTARATRSSWSSRRRSSDTLVLSGQLHLQREGREMETPAETSSSTSMIVRVR